MLPVFVFVLLFVLNSHCKFKAFFALGERTLLQYALLCTPHIRHNLDALSWLWGFARCDWFSCLVHKKTLSNFVYFQKQNVKTFFDTSCWKRSQNFVRQHNDFCFLKDITTLLLPVQKPNSEICYHTRQNHNILSLKALKIRENNF